MNHLYLLTERVPDWSGKNVAGMDEATFELHCAYRWIRAARAFREVARRSETPVARAYCYRIYRDYLKRARRALACVDHEW